MTLSEGRTHTHKLNETSLTHSKSTAWTRKNSLYVTTFLCEIMPRHAKKHGHWKHTWSLKQVSWQRLHPFAQINWFVVDGNLPIKLGEANDNEGTNCSGWARHMTLSCHQLSNISKKSLVQQPSNYGKQVYIVSIVGLYSFQQNGHYAKQHHTHTKPCLKSCINNQIIY